MISSAITFHPIPALKDNYIWAMVHTEKRSAMIVDPGEAAPVIDFLKQQQLALAAILITHHHWDHTSGVLELKKLYDVPVFGSAQEKVTGLTTHLNEHDEIIVPFFPTLTTIAIPGHTLGHIALHAKELNCLFSGDTLFAAGCGRLFEGTPAQMYASLQKLALLPDHTHIYCGHEYTLQNLQFAAHVEPNNKKIVERIAQVEALRQRGQPSLPTLLKEEKATNPFLRCAFLEVTVSVEKQVGKKLHDAVDVFAALREWKNGYK